jgi:hypothetical protein
MYNPKTNPRTRNLPARTSREPMSGDLPVMNVARLVSVLCKCDPDEVVRMYETTSFAQSSLKVV